MLIIKSTGIMFGLAVLLGTLSCAPILQRTSAQNATGNVTNGHTENLVVRGQSVTQPVSIIDCMLPTKQVPALGLTFTASNESGKLNGWWNIPSSAGGNNVGGKISQAKVAKNMFEVKGTMNYDYLCAKKNNLDYEISIIGNCGGNGTITFSSGREISSHNFTGSVIC